jgi:glycosyltransferase involved in cell wall biosynthesis
MNILYISNHLNIGGITSYLLTLATGMKKRGHHVYIASSGGDLIMKFTKQGIIFVPIPIRTKKECSPKILFSILKLSKFIKNNAIDIVHSNSRTTQVLGYLLESRTKAAHIFTCHGFFKNRLSRRLFPCWGKANIAISDQVREHLVKDLNADEKNIFVIYNGIDIEKFRSTENGQRQTGKMKFGLGEGPVIGIIARLSDVKGHIYLVKAMESVLESFPTAQLVILGEGKTREELVKVVKILGIEKHVFFIDEIDDTGNALSAMDLFVMPSLREGLGLALMEAMASGLPVIGSDIGGIRSLIKHRLNGLLVKPASASELSQAILELLHNPDTAKSLGERARAFINENFSQEQMVFKTEELYLKCQNTKN